MMRAARRTTLLVAFYLLASAATASAECAWVMWEKKLPMYPVPNPASDERQFVTWKLHAAFENKQACEEFRIRQLPSWEEEKREELKKPADQQIVRLGLVCLPDTVDPRGPKAK